jgi:DNA polymerase-3 subunit epsilon
MKEPDGKPVWVRSADPRQPHLVQLAASLVDVESRTIIESLDLIIRPDGWTIPDETIAIHGITNERAAAEGVDEKEAVTRFLDLWLRADRRMAYNEDFDARLLRIALARYGWPEDQAEAWKAGAAVCTMKLATPIVKAPAKNGRKGYKWPSLAEACAHFGIEHTHAHNASADVTSALAVFWAIEDLNRAGASAISEGETYVR